MLVCPPATVVGAVALRGEGVMETLHALLQGAWRNLDERMRVARNIGLGEKEFLTHVFQQMDLKGTPLEALYPPPGGTPR